MLCQSSYLTTDNALLIASSAITGALAPASPATIQGESSAGNVIDGKRVVPTKKTARPLVHSHTTICTFGYNKYGINGCGFDTESTCASAVSPQACIATSGSCKHRPKHRTTGKVCATPTISALILPHATPPTV
jgi:hypothetical protein